MYSVEEAILRTVAYADIFDYPLTINELHRYLIGCLASKETIETALVHHALLCRVLVEVDGYFAFRERAEIASIRRSRQANAHRIWPDAWRYGYLIAQLPFVRMVAVTGSLAANNVDPNADIDYLIVTETGRLWSCRAFVILMVHLAARRGVSLCPNFFLSERALVFQERTLYSARELVQMVPIVGFSVYQRLRTLNQWTSTYLPNTEYIPSPQDPQQSRGNIWGWLGISTCRLTERVLCTPLGDPFEQWEMRRKIRKLKARHPRCDSNIETNFSVDQCKGHFEGHGTRILAAYEERVNTLTQML